MSVDHSGHRQRLKRAYRENGLMSFSPHEVIELMLYTALPRRDVNELAHRISEQCGGVDRLMRMDESEMLKKLDISPHVARTLSAYGAAVRLYGELSGMSARRLETRGDKNELIRQVYKPGCRVLVLLGAGREVIHISDLPEGSIVSTVLRRVLYYDAARVITLCPARLAIDEGELTALKMALNDIDAALDDAITIMED